MFNQTFPQEISFLLKIKAHNLPQSKNFRKSQKFPRTMSACPRLFPCLRSRFPICTRPIEINYAPSKVYAGTDVALFTTFKGCWVGGAD